MNNPQAGPNPKATGTLWTRDFTIITVGSVVSLFGNALAGFAMALLVLDYTKSTFLFALFNIVYFMPSVVMPVLSGPFLDRFSRKKTIYTLDFITAGIYAVFALMMKAGIFNFAILAGGAFLLGVIGSVYQVAFDSFYPLTISEGNYSKAYSVSSTMHSLSMLMMPLSAFIYNTMGIVPLFAINTVTYFVAAVMETRIKQGEDYMTKNLEESAGRAGLRGLRRFAEDFKAGMGYLYSEKGLMAITAYFTFSSILTGANSTMTLPYFKSSFRNGEYIFMIVGGALSFARVVGGAVHYRLRIPTHLKFNIALTVYITISLIDGFYLFAPLPAMVALCFTNGLLGVTSYNIRISATQRYVPDEKKGRFNGAFNTLTMGGMLLGQFIAGALSMKLPIRLIYAILGTTCAAAAVLIVGGSRKRVAEIYNTQD